MSIHQLSVTSPLEILSSPLNDSTAKYHYSFSKSPRFTELKSYCSTAFYELPSTKQRRAPSFGKGTKYDFTQTSVTSVEAQYNRESDFDQERSIKKGKSFGLSRELAQAYGYITIQGLQTPGPGTYKQNSQLSKQGYSMRPKTADINGPVHLGGQRSYLDNPAPGSYEITPGINKDGKWMYAKYENSRATVFNPPNSKRFPSTSQYTPGPGHYKPKDYISKEGKYLLSTTKGSGARMFLQGERSSFVDQFSRSKLSTPGPGNYRTPSDFGHYDHLDSFRQTQSISRNNKCQNGRYLNSSLQL